MSREDFDLLRDFLENRDVSQRAAKPLKDSAIIDITIVDDPNSYHVTHQKKQTRVHEGEAPSSPQIRFTISPAAIARLHKFESNDIGEYGIEFFKIMVSKNPDETLEVKLNTGFIGLTRMGVFGILALGGPSVMAFLAKQGLSSLKDIRKTIAKLRGKED